MEKNGSYAKGSPCWFCSKRATTESNDGEGHQVPVCEFHAKLHADKELQLFKSAGFSNKHLPQQV